MKKIVAAIIGLIIIAGSIAGAFALQGGSSPHKNTSDSQPATINKGKTTVEQNPGTLQQTDEVLGTGPEAVSGKQVTVNYLGTLTDGTKFDSSYDRNQPFTFALGGGQVIKGWDQGVAGMKVGGKRKLVIPPDLAYGAQSPSPSIPPISTLVFEVELLGIQ